ncbi:MAG: hypothetical protein ACOZNI_26005 [Myxococcota bacterium]
MSWKAWWTPALFSALAVAWTWPAAFSGELLGHQPDTPGTVWFIDAAPRLLRSLTDTETGWPEPVTYTRPDSFTLMWLASLFAFVPPAWIHGLVQVVGVATSAWAAEAFARALGAKPPWSLLAGATFACCGLASSALLEGYAYHVLNPWMPLLAWAWYRATSPAGRWQHGVLAGLAWLLTLFTTAWLGIAAAVLVVGFFAGALWRERGRIRWRPPLAALATLAVPLAIYLRTFFSREAGEVDTGAVTDVLPQIGLAAIRAVGPIHSTDLLGHNQTAQVPAVGLALLAAAPAVLARHPGWRVVAVTGLGAFLLSFWPRLPLSELPAWLPDTATRAIELLYASLLRFPARIGWTWALCAGAVGACVATRLAERAPKAAMGLWAIALIDLFGVARQPWRQVASPSDVPSAYAAQAGPVLDLWPENIDRAPDWTIRTTNTGCFYQTAHGRPIADHCIANLGVESPRIRIGRWLVSELLAGRPAEAAAKLGALGFTTVALHPDLFHAGDRARLASALNVIDASPTRTTDGGETVVAYRIPEVAGADPAAEWSTWAD